MMNRMITPQILGLFLTLFLGCYSVYQSDIMNHDAVLYLRVADLFVTQGASQAYQLYHWPFYSFLIGMVSQLFGISSFYSACFINILFQMGITYIFISLIKELGGSLRVQWIALAILLLFPPLQSYRAYIVRDFGFWFFYLLAIKSYLDFVKSQNWGAVYLWGGSMLLASLFRIEGLAFFFLQPFFIFLLGGHCTWKSKCWLFFRINSVLIGLALMTAIYLFFSDQNFWQVGRFNHIRDVFNVGHTVKLNVLHIAEVLSTNVLNQPGQHDAIPMAVSSILGLVIYKVTKIINPFNLFFIAYAISMKTIPSTNQQRQLSGFVLVNLLLLIYFVSSFDFLSSRYVMGVALTCLLWVPFGIDYFIERCYQKKLFFVRTPLIASVTCCSLLLIVSGAILHKKGDKTYIRSASSFLRHILQEDQTIYTNSPQLLYYVKGASKQWDQEYDPSLKQLTTAKLKQYDFYAIQMPKDPQRAQHIEQILGREKLAVFSSRHSGQMVIYE